MRKLLFLPVALVISGCAATPTGVVTKDKHIVYFPESLKNNPCVVPEIPDKEDWMESDYWGLLREHRKNLIDCAESREGAIEELSEAKKNFEGG